MFRRLCLAAMLLVICGGIASAQFTDVGKERWTFGEFFGTEKCADGKSTWGYQAVTAQVERENDCLYAELEEDYQLFIWNHSFGKWSSVVRADDRLFRVGIQAPLGDTGWSARVLTGAMPDRLDLYTKALEICAEAESGFKFTTDGWLKLEQGCKPDPRVGFNFGWKGVCLSVWYNLRTEEVDSTWLTAPALTTSF